MKRNTAKRATEWTNVEETPAIIWNKRVLPSVRSRTVNALDTVTELWVHVYRITLSEEKFVGFTYYVATYFLVKPWLPFGCNLTMLLTCWPLRSKLDIFELTVIAMLANIQFFRPHASEMIPVKNEPISIPAKKIDWRVAPRKPRSQMRFHLKYQKENVKFKWFVYLSKQQKSTLFYMLM